ncbi:hypothetical protein DL766_008960 [Monosporascus sp. MC13-8B]|uniref:ACB domain-containing protein n=1 Tax=Monosporascus cannonballus TaxID=155416 RepID=A0ABY0GY00_9PEZI|nr:hypothetical protein DL762_009226 [Monosporascus cannonballus]RYO80847.1 hypothetical protein DL763_008780 [Monosporascus cannonballus]RYP17175.1 hypothetical protein DL766_008960 [Monosporascus sp. MC13-8B]
MATSEAFQKAAVDSKKLTSKPTNEDLLDLYAFYKVANGEDISKATAPGMFDLKGKAKYNAWKKVVDEGVTQEQAQEKYIAKVEEMKTQYGYDEKKEPETVGTS